MSGASQQPNSYGFGEKISQMTGTQQPSSYAEKVQETMSNKTPEEILKEKAAMKEQAIQQQMQQQMQQQPIQQPMQQRYSQPVMQQQRPQMNWNNVTPQQAATVDTSYAKYLEETKGESVYRRGPYKKRQ